MSSFVQALRRNTAYPASLLAAAASLLAITCSSPNNEEPGPSAGAPGTGPTAGSASTVAGSTGSPGAGSSSGGAAGSPTTPTAGNGTTPTSGSGPGPAGGSSSGGASGGSGPAPTAGTGTTPTAGTGNGSAGTGSGGGPSTDPPACSTAAAPAIKRLGLQTVVQSNDLNVMVFAAQPPGSNDWYLVDALGIIRVFTNGALQETPFLDVKSEVQGSGFSGNGAPSGGSQNYDERGLLSIAFPPDYATSGKFYVTLIPTSGSLTDHDLLLEYTRSASNPLVADPSTRKAIVDLEPGGEGYTMGSAFSYAKFHNGSTAIFGPDGKLYWGLGDGGGECNAARRGTPQDVSSPYGKILRLDPSAPAPYAAADNPFASGGDARVFHYGVRNPFRFSFDPLNGDLYIGEVGQWTNDSIAHAPGGSKGVNFGWPSFEGTTKNPSSQCNNNTPLRSGSTRRDPIFNLAHGSTGGVANLITTIVGGAVYRGTAIPELRGAYLFAEFYPNRPMRALYQCGDETSPVTQIGKRCDPNTPNAPCFQPVNGAPELRQVGAIVQGNDGELYIPANGNAVLKIVPVAQ